MLSALCLMPSNIFRSIMKWAGSKRKRMRRERPQPQERCRGVFRLISFFSCCHFKVFFSEREPFWFLNASHRVERGCLARRRDGRPRQGRFRNCTSFRLSDYERGFYRCVRIQ